MADLVPVIANARMRSGSVAKATAGATIVPMDVIYLDAADSNKAKLADNSTVAKANARGIALTYAGVGDVLIYALDGAVIELGTTATDGTDYYVSDNAGKIAPVGDLGTGDYVTRLGYGDDNSDLKLAINATGNAKP